MIVEQHYVFVCFCLYISHPKEGDVTEFALKKTLRWIFDTCMVLLFYNPGRPIPLLQRSVRCVFPALL